MTEIILRKQLKGLFPIDEAGEKTVSSIGSGDLVRVKISRPRNIQHHRKFFALCKLVAGNTEMVANEEELRARLLVAVGHCNRYMKGNGEWIEVPKSISFAAMGQDEFNEIYGKCVDVICTVIIPGMSTDVLQNEVLEMVA